MLRQETETFKHSTDYVLLHIYIYTVIHKLSLTETHTHTYIYNRSLALKIAKRHEAVKRKDISRCHRANICEIVEKIDINEAI